MKTLFSKLTDSMPLMVKYAIILFLALTLIHAIQGCGGSDTEEGGIGLDESIIDTDLDGVVDQDDSDDDNDTVPDSTDPSSKVSCFIQDSDADGVVDFFDSDADIDDDGINNKTDQDDNGDGEPDESVPEPHPGPIRD